MEVGFILDEVRAAPGSTEKYVASFHERIIRHDRNALYIPSRPAPDTESLFGTLTDSEKRRLLEGDWAYEEKNNQNR